MHAHAVGAAVDDGGAEFDQFDEVQREAAFFDEAFQGHQVLDFFAEQLGVVHALGHDGSSCGGWGIKIRDC